MKFELIGKTNATLQDIDIQSLKQGQTDLKPAIALTFVVQLPNTSLNMLDRHLLAFFFEKADPAKQVQAQLDGVPGISHLEALTDAAKMLGAQRWADEQTGCTLVIYQGVNNKFTLKDGTIEKLKMEFKEGGAVEWTFRFYTADVDAETIGDIGVLKSHDMDIELTVPELISAKQKPLAPAKPKKMTKDEAAAAAQALFLKGQDEKDAAAAAATGAKPLGPNDAAWPFPKDGAVATH